MLHWGNCNQEIEDLKNKIKVLSDAYEYLKKENLKLKRKRCRKKHAFKHKRLASK